MGLFPNVSGSQYSNSQIKTDIHEGASNIGKGVRQLAGGIGRLLVKATVTTVCLPARTVCVAAKQLSKAKEGLKKAFNGCKAAVDRLERAGLRHGAMLNAYVSSTLRNMADNQAASATQKLARAEASPRSNPQLRIRVSSASAARSENA
jgi:hypothetical protein